MLVQDEALPHPSKMEKLFELGLVAQTQRGQLKQYRFFELREPGWGRLILAAIYTSVDAEKVRFDTVTRHPVMAAVLSTRLKRERLLSEHGRLWESLAKEKAKLASKLAGVPLSWIGFLLGESQLANQADLTSFLWHTVESQPDSLTARVWETQLHFVASFLEKAQGHPAVTKIIWDALEKESEKVTARVWETQLHLVASFLEKAQGHPAVTKIIWDALEKEPDQLVTLAWETSLADLASFLEKAQGHPLVTKTIWEALEKERDRVAARASETSLEHVASFMEVAKAHERDTRLLWDAILGRADDPEREASSIS